MTEFQIAYQPTIRVQVFFPDPTLTKQSFKDECDVNNIMKKFEKTGLLDHVNNHKGDYGNYIGYEDYQTSLNRIASAQDAFNTIPASIRARFDNSPLEFLRFAQNPENFDKMVEMGLANQPEEPRGEDQPATGVVSPSEPKGAEGAPEGAPAALE